MEGWGSERQGRKPTPSQLPGDPGRGQEGKETLSVREPRHCPHCLPCRFENHQQVSPLEQAESHHPKFREPQEERTASGTPPGCPDLLIATHELLEIPVSRSGVDLGICFLTTVLGLSPASSKGKLDSLEKQLILGLVQGR